MNERPPEVEMFGKPIPDYEGRGVKFTGCRIVTDPAEQAALDRWDEARDVFEAQFTEGDS